LKPLHVGETGLHDVICRLQTPYDKEGVRILSAIDLLLSLYDSRNVRLYDKLEPVPAFDIESKTPFYYGKDQVPLFFDNMIDFSRNPMGLFRSHDRLRPGNMRFFNIIPEKFPPYSIWRDGVPCADLNDLSRLFDLHWESSHYIVPVLEEQACRYMFQLFLSQHSDHHVVHDNHVGAPPILKGILFAVAALSAKYNDEGASADFYYELARTAIAASHNSASFELLESQTLDGLMRRLHLRS
jgi:hypothetical protein